MRPSEFEEREYEAPLYVQLQHASTSVWAPGQVLEAHVGFDHSLYTSHPYFWRLHGFATPPAGVVLGDYPPGHWWGHRHDLHRQLPDFSLNLFIQAKRPLLGSRATKALKDKGVSGPFWKFIVSSEQQLVLEALSQSTAGSALVVYACAAFDRVTQLWAHSRAGSIVQTSTFPLASSLRGHGAWYYNSPGCKGVANPTPERIEGPPLLERIRTFTTPAPQQRSEAIDFAQNLRGLATAVEQAALGKDRAASGRSSVYAETLRLVDRFIEFGRATSYSEAIRSYLSVATFASVFGLQWYALVASDA